MFYTDLLSIIKLNNACKATAKKDGPLHYLFLYFPVFYIMGVLIHNRKKRKSKNWVM